MRKLNYQLKDLCRRNRDGCRATQRDRERQLTLFANELHALGFRRLAATSLRTRHVEALVKHWQGKGLSSGTMKNRMANLRWWAEKVNKQNVVARDNDFYGIAKRSFVTNVSKARSLAANVLDHIKDPYVRISLGLQKFFGLRREEAIKFIPSYADRGDHVLLKSSWTKGGKERLIPIRTDAQRDVLQRAHQLAGSGSMIPSHLRYVDQLRIYERQTADAGLSKMHGLRHAYAQQRYEELTGWKSPAAGGPTAVQLSPERKAIDREARLAISRELGHEREQVTAIYLGR